MKQFLVTMAGVFAGLVVFFIGLPMLLIIVAAHGAKPAAVPSQAVLELDLRDPITDQEPSNPLASLGRRSTSVMSIIETLHRAEKDGAIKGLFVRLPEGGLEPGTADELRLAFRSFRASGKPIIAHSQGFYPTGMVVSTYMLGASSGELWMQPGASFQATGVASEDIFFKRFFDKYGIEADYEQRYEYKNAVNPYLYDDYTPEHRQAQLSWMTSIYSTSLANAAADRKLTLPTLQAAIEAGPYLADDALRLKLIDRIGQVKEAEQALLDRAGKDAKLVEMDDYRRSRRADELGGGNPAIAVIEAEGPIVTGHDGAANPFSGSPTIYSDDIADALYKAAKDDSVKAVVFRVNSPGGSDTASEQILAGVRAAKAANKPVVVSMGTYGASGGYWIASEASAIVAQPSTLTGSIGVFGGKFAVADALARFGVDIRGINVGSDYSRAFSVGQGFTPEQRAAFAGWMDRIYANFIARVAEGRKLPVQRVREIAKGHVWTGAQARELGLVDEVGGFYQAVAKAKSLAGIKGEAHLKRMSPTTSPFEALQQALGVSATSVRTLAAAAWLLGDPKAQSVMDDLAAARMRDGGALVLAPTSVR